MDALSLHRLERKGRSRFVLEAEQTLFIIVSLSATQRVSLRIGDRVFDEPARIRSATVIPPGHKSFFDIQGPGSVLIASLPVKSLAAWLAEEQEIDIAHVNFLPRLHVRDDPMAQAVFAATRGDSESVGRTIAARLLSHHSSRHGSRTWSRGGLSQSGLRRALDLIEANPTASLSLDSIAREAGVSPFHFAREFRRTMGVPPHRYVLLQRIDLALSLLAKSEQTISEIARAAGFASGGHLARHLRSQTGFSPAEFRRHVFGYPLLGFRSD